MKKRLTYVAVIILVGLSIVNIPLGLHLMSITAYAQADTQPDEAAEEDGIPVETNQIPGWPEGPTVNARSAVVMEVSTGAVLYEKNADEPLYPASITKIMTVLLAIENGSMDDTVTMTEDALFNTEGSMVALDVGEQLTLEQCLYAIMLESANNVSYAVAEHIGGTYNNFVSMMNDRAAELGCSNTHFNNPHGLPDEEHYTSAADMALISKEALEYDLFRKVTGAVNYTLPPTNKYDGERTWGNHHKMLPKKEQAYDGCFGGKTGYTDAASFTLVTFARRDGTELICVTMKTLTPVYYPDTASLLDYGFSGFKKTSILPSNADASFQTASFLDLSVFEPERNGTVILPKGSALEDTAVHLSFDKDDTYLTYTYSGRYIGRIAVVFGEADSSRLFLTRLRTDSDDSNIIRIHKRNIITGICLIVFAVLIYLVLHFIKSHFHFTPRSKGRKFKHKGRKISYKYKDLDF